MNEAHVMQIATQAMYMTMKLAAPVLLVSLAIGLAVSLLQSITQLQEVTLTFVPKLVGIAAVFMVAGHWMLAQFVAYVQGLFGQVTSLLAGG